MKNSLEIIIKQVRLEGSFNKAMSPVHGLPENDDFFCLREYVCVREPTLIPSDFIFFFLFFLNLDGQINPKNCY